MKTAFEIFKGDLKRASSNLIGIVVLIGLSLVPALYAWFSIAGSWDPYGNTGGLKVAVANSDEGYQSDLLPVPVNIGDTVESTLRANDSFDWTFTTEEDAVDGVKSGEYYAAIVMPSTFSSDMMTVFSDDVHHASIVYYSNEKENAIAPHVTDKGASTVQSQIDETFTSTVDQIVLNTTANLAKFVSGDGMKNYASLLDSSMEDAEGVLDSAASQTSALADLAEASSGLIESSSALTSATGGANDAARDAADSAKTSISDASSAIERTVELVDDAISQSSEAFDSTQDAVDEAFDAAMSQPSDAAAVLRDLSDKVAASADDYRGIRDAVAAFDPQSPLLPKLDQAVAKVEGLQSSLSSSADRIEEATRSAAEDRESIKAEIAEARNAAGSLRSSFEESLGKNADDLAASLETVRSSSEEIASSFESAVDSLAGPVDSADRTLKTVATSLHAVSSELRETKDGLSEARAELDDAIGSEDFERVAEVIGSNPANMASFLAAPVDLQRHAVYGVENNGSAMAGFYTVLSIWVGSIILAAMLKVGLSDRRKEELGEVKPHQSYFGRFGIFALLALAQSTVVCLGDLFLLGIQCEHPVLFVAAGWLASLVFCSIVYTLTVSFGDIGKAACVVLLVMQVAGSGGIFPIEMTPPFFQHVYPFLPFTPAIDAMHACIAGILGNEYAVSMAKLAAFFVPVLLLGLVLRKPVIRLNDFVIRKMEETKLM